MSARSDPAASNGTQADERDLHPVEIGEAASDGHADAAGHEAQPEDHAGGDADSPRHQSLRDDQGDRERGVRDEAEEGSQNDPLRTGEGGIEEERRDGQRDSAGNDPLLPDAVGEIRRRRGVPMAPAPIITAASGP